jgi:hypothetical protein
MEQVRWEKAKTNFTHILTLDRPGIPRSLPHEYSLRGAQLNLRRGKKLIGRCMLVWSKIRLKFNYYANSTQLYHIFEMDLP